ncbi:uncharacterized protein LOC126966468 isoform X2 [Leptidea sinapis]|uniref:uncharacterized protein LOC126966468 isoform X2 n=1 Tax=Leptidea sinapis TaxID=189913 RepID=UPI0021C2CEFA|nr:uncharacterized protein LOC126966468 isoform X2 [Leptidea sinapis]
MPPKKNLRKLATSPHERKVTCMKAKRSPKVSQINTSNQDNGNAGRRKVILRKELVKNEFKIENDTAESNEIYNIGSKDMTTPQAPATKYRKFVKKKCENNGQTVMCELKITKANTGSRKVIVREELVKNEFKIESDTAESNEIYNSASVAMTTPQAPATKCRKYAKKKCEDNGNNVMCELKITKGKAGRRKVIVRKKLVKNEEKIENDAAESNEINNTGSIEMITPQPPATKHRKYVKKKCKNNGKKAKQGKHLSILKMTRSKSGRRNLEKNEVKIDNGAEITNNINNTGAFEMATLPPPATQTRKYVKKKCGPENNGKNVYVDIMKENKRNIEKFKSSNLLVGKNIQNFGLCSRPSSYRSPALFWTKTMSSTRLTACCPVTSKDIVCIDRKLPIIILDKIDNKNNLVPEVGGEGTTDSRNLNADDDNHITKETQSETTPTMLYFSTSMSDAISLEKNQSHISALDRLRDELETVSNISVQPVYFKEDMYPQDNLLQKELSQNEKKFKVSCEDIKKRLKSLTNEVLNIDEQTNPLINSTVFVPINDKNNNDGQDLGADNPNETTQTSLNDSETENNNKIVLNLSQKNDEDVDNDDGDTISLYAESITAFETNTKPSTYLANIKSAVLEEYVPKPISTQFKTPKPIIYNPTKKIELKEQSLTRTNTIRVCEKHNADSTSLQNGFESFENRSLPNLFSNILSNQEEITFRNQIDDNQPLLMRRLYKPTDLLKSTIFTGVCIFYNVSKCKKSICNYPHTVVSFEHVKKQLIFLSRETFIEEYLLLRKTPKLMQRYGLFYVDECIRRNLSGFLVEMAMDFIMWISDLDISKKLMGREAIERMLLYLNHIELSVCADILKLSMTPKSLLCEEFLAVIATTQNFSRFRTVFVNLTKLICNTKRTFSNQIVLQIMERICILPYELSLARTLIEMFRYSDRSIFQNDMIGNFEKKMLKENSNLYSAFIDLKNGATSLVDPVNVTEEEAQPSVQLEKDVRCSPDTTILDYLSKSLEDTNRKPNTSVSIVSGCSGVSPSNQICPPPIWGPRQRNIQPWYTPGPSTPFNNVRIVRPGYSKVLPHRLDQKKVKNRRNGPYY